MADLYTEAAESFEQHLRRVEAQGRKESPDWHLANGLLRLAQGLRHDHDEEEYRRKSIMRPWLPRK